MVKIVNYIIMKKVYFYIIKIVSESTFKSARILKLFFISKLLATQK
jgi:hypothetical protein